MSWNPAACCAARQVLNDPVAAGVRPAAIAAGASAADAEPRPTATTSPAANMRLVSMTISPI